MEAGASIYGSSKDEMQSLSDIFSPEMKGGGVCDIGSGLLSMAASSGSAISSSITGIVYDETQNKQEGKVVYDETHVSSSFMEALGLATRRMSATFLDDTIVPHTPSAVLSSEIEGDSFFDVKLVSTDSVLSENSAVSSSVPNIADIVEGGQVSTTPNKRFEGDSLVTHEEVRGDVAGDGLAPEGGVFNAFGGVPGDDFMEGDAGAAGDPAALEGAAPPSSPAQVLMRSTSLSPEAEALWEEENDLEQLWRDFAVDYFQGNLPGDESNRFSACSGGGVDNLGTDPRWGQIACSASFLETRGSASTGKKKTAKTVGACLVASRGIAPSLRKPLWLEWSGGRALRQALQQDILHDSSNGVTYQDLHATHQEMTGRDGIFADEDDEGDGQDGDAEVCHRTIAKDVERTCMEVS